MFTQTKVGSSRLHRTHLPKRRLSSLISAAKQGCGLAGGRAIQHSTFCGLGIASQLPAIESRFVAGQVWEDTTVRGQRCSRAGLFEMSDTVPGDPYGGL